MDSWRDIGWQTHPRLAAFGWLAVQKELCKEPCKELPVPWPGAIPGHGTVGVNGGLLYDIARRLPLAALYLARRCRGHSSPPQTDTRCACTAKGLHWAPVQATRLRGGDRLKWSQVSLQLCGSALQPVSNLAYLSYVSTLADVETR